MLYAAIICVLALEVVSAHFMGADAWVMASVTQAEAAIMAVLAYNVASDPKLKRLFFLVAGYFIYISVTDLMTIDFPSWWLGFESAVLALCCGAILSTPERLPSYSGDNVALAFYNGPLTPPLARVASLCGLPYVGVAVVVKGVVMWPDGKVNKLSRREVKRLPRTWTMLDTGRAPNVDIETEFAMLDGKDISRVGCVRAIRPVLNMLGLKAVTPGGLARELLNGNR
jgi:hypothetical protein